MDEPAEKIARSVAYDAQYYARDCGTPYARNADWLGFFDRAADWIVGTIQPATVLDAGCAFGFLVEKLRERGVEAWGIDISEHAIAQVAPEVAPYCRVGSVLEPFERRYDLITCIEVLEHLTPPEGLAAIANLAAHTDDLLFSSTPEDFREVTHQNVQPPDHWARLFAGHGMVRDTDYDASYLTAWARRFRRPAGTLGDVVAAYERSAWRLEREASARREQAIEQRDVIITLEAETAAALAAQSEAEARLLDARRETLAVYDRVAALTVQLEWRLDQVTALQAWHDAVVASPGWQLVARLQNARTRLVPPASRRQRALESALARARLGGAPPDTTGNES